MQFARLFLLCATILLLTACTPAAGVRQIAVAPHPTPITRYPAFVYTGYLELQVADVDAAAKRAAQLAESYGGYQLSAQSWRVDNRTVTTLELAVPHRVFDGLRGALLELGVLRHETVSSRPVDPPSEPVPYASITLHLRPADPQWPIDPPPSDWTGGWNPARTFQRAFAVFLTIFGFLADVLIWIVVVAGPFLLLAAVVWFILRRHRTRSSS